MSSYKTIISVLMTLSLIAGSTMAQAQYMSTSTTRQTVQYKNNESSAAAQARKQYGGKVLSVSKSTANGRTVFKVKLLLDSGRIKVVTIPE